MIRDADIAAWFSTAPFADVAVKLNALPDAGRTVTFASNNRNGYFWRTGDGCSFAELQGGGDLTASGTFSNFAVVPQPDGSIDLNANIQLHGAAQVHLHVSTKGPFGCFGGVGTSVGLRAETASPLSTKLVFVMAPGSSDIDYVLHLVGPSAINVATTVLIPPPIGNQTLGSSVPIPARDVASGKLPLKFARQGEFQLPAGAGTRTYTMKLTPVRFGADDTGVGAAWKADVQFAARPTAATVQK